MTSEQLQCLDYSIYNTRNKGELFNSRQHVTSALKQFYFCNNSIGFTTNNNARDYIESLSKEDIEKELLIEVIKKKTYAIKQGYAQKLSIDKTFDDYLTSEDTELLIINNIQHYPMEVTKYLIDKYPKIIDKLIDSFVDTRYFNTAYRAEQLDEMVPYCNDLIEKIEKYYSELKINDQLKQY